MTSQASSGFSGARPADAARPSLAQVAAELDATAATPVRQPDAQRHQVGEAPQQHLVPREQPPRSAEASRTHLDPAPTALASPAHSGGAHPADAPSVEARSAHAHPADRHSADAHPSDTHAADTHAVDSHPGEATEAVPEVRRVTRDPEDAWLGGVASGIAHHLGWPVMTVRLGFVALSFVYFLGVFVYGLLWVLLPVAEPEEEAPGIESATRRGLRQRTNRSRTTDVGAISGLVLLAGGLVWGSWLLGLGVQARYFWPIAFAATGLALVWRQADDSQSQVPSGTPSLLRPFVTLGGWAALVRLAAGFVLMGFALFLILATRIPLESLPWVLSTTVLVLAGGALVGAPWIYRARRKMQANHQARVLADARADVAAHLHDSVLQTLALIQRQADDPRAVGSLARRQERELRDWLYGGMADQTQLKAALTVAAQEVENEAGVPVEVVVVGDAEVTTNLNALVQAAREAMMNAAKHSGAAKIDVYGEVDQGAVEVFVRDRGRGFDAATVAQDRMGVRRSIIERMERHGGQARVRSAPDQGTEIRLEMPL